MEKLRRRRWCSPRTGATAARARPSWRRSWSACATSPPSRRFVYEDADPLWDKINKIAKKVYRAGEVTADAKVRAQIKKLQDDGYGHYPVCVAKTQSSFSTDARCAARPTDHVVNVREVRLAAGAEFVVMICGDIMTMPGLPKVPVGRTRSTWSTARSSGCSRIRADARTSSSRRRSGSASAQIIGVNLSCRATTRW